MSASFKLYHFPFDPHSRLARLALGELKLGFEEVVVKYWAPSDDFIRLNPSGALPVLTETQSSGIAITFCENRAIIEHLGEGLGTGGSGLWPEPVSERAEARRLLGWLERKFDFEVNAHLLYEKMEKRFLNQGAPEIMALKAGREALRDHLSYFERLLEARHYLAGRTLSFADLALGAHISVIDYIDEVSWAKYPQLKNWYMALKSRPCFRPLLNDTLPGITASAHYKELDF
jgi:glutathione S-transferase